MNEIYKNRKKTTKVKTRSRNIKNDLNNHLTTYAYNSNDLIIANETYKTQINNLSKYIKNLKNIFFTNINNKKTIYDKIFNINQTISKINIELKNDIQNLAKNYNDKIERNNNNLKGLNSYLEELKEDNFLLENSLKTKDFFIKIFSNEIANINPISEKYVLYSVKLRECQIKELTNAQINLNQLSKETNRETLKSHRLKEEMDNLKNEKEKIKFNNLNKNLVKNEIYFSDFEKDESNSSITSDLFSEINYNLDIDLNTINKVIKKSNIENIVKKQKEQIKIKNLNLNLKNNVPKNSNTNTKIPKLNLKQIEFNMGNIIKEKNIEINDNNDELNKENEIIYKIKKIKKHIKKEKEKNKKLLKLIKKFEKFQKNYNKNNLDNNYDSLNNKINNVNKIKVIKNYKNFNTNKEDLDTYPTS